MATITKRRNKNRTLSWIAQVRRRGWPAQTRAFTTKLAAELWAAQTERRIGDGTLPIGERITFSELLKQVRPRLKSPSTAALTYWDAQFGPLQIGKIAPALISAHRDRLLGEETRMYNHKRSRPRSAGTVTNWLNTLSRVFSLGVKELHWLTDNPMSRVTRPKLPRGRQRWLSDEEITALLSACKASGAQQLYPFVLLLLTTGMRAGEAYNLRWGDIDVERRWAVLMRTKTDTARGAPLTQPVLDALMKMKRKGERIFATDMTKAWRSAVKRSGITDFRMHDLRHTAASLLVRDGATLFEVGRLLGHKDTRMTDRYSHLAHETTADMVNRVMGGMR